MDSRDARVILETGQHRIVGTLQLPREGFRSRMTDFLNGLSGSFVALTDVELAPCGGGEVTERLPFLAVSVQHIVLATEAAG